jgi:hypothetical protein
VAKRWTWVAWSMLAIFLASMGGGIALMVVNGEFQQDPAGHGSLLLAFTTFMVVGAVVVAQRPGNRVGWVFSAIGLLAATGVLAWQYAEYAYTTRGGSLPGAILCAWYTAWWWYPVISLASVFTLLLFPSGRLLSPRWRPVTLLAAAAILVFTVMSALQPTLGLVGGTEIRNPIGLAAIPDPDAGTLGGVLAGLIVVSTGAAALSLVLRFRRSQGVERQQLKWFTYGGALVFLGLLVADLLPDFPGSGLLFGVAVALLPVTAGIAILRYRLYDIDRLINRTLVYGLLTALLAAVYAGAVLFLGQVFGGVGGDPPSWAVAGATLAVAALFQPARRRIQAIVDRRFNRRKYNTAQTIEAFSTRLRDQVDLDTLSAELLATVDQTMQPTAASLWLRPPHEEDSDAHPTHHVLSSRHTSA